MNAYLQSKEELTSDERLTVLSFAIHYGDQQSDAISIDELAKKISMRPHIVMRCMASLIKQGLIYEQPMLDGAGRPLRMFRLNIDGLSQLNADDLLALKDNEAVTLLIQKGLIPTPGYCPNKRPDKTDWNESLVRRTDLNDQGVSPGGRHGAGVQRMVEGRLGYLDSAYMLMLAAMTAASDRFGVVRGLSAGDLASIAGVSSLAIKGRLKKLKMWGVVRQIIPGIANALFSKKLKSIIVLNLNHEMLDFYSESPKVVISHDEEVGEDHYRFVYGLWHEVKMQRPVNIDLICLQQLKGLPLHGFQQLEFELHRLAGEAFNALVLARPMAKLKQVEIDQFVKPSLMKFLKPSAGSEKPESWTFDMLIGCFEFLIYLMVLELADRVEPHIGEKRTGIDLMFLPGNLTKGYEYITILVAGDGQKDSRVAIAKRRGDLPPEEFNCESDMPVDTRKATGLVQ